MLTLGKIKLGEECTGTFCTHLLSHSFSRWAIPSWHSWILCLGVSLAAITVSVRLHSFLEHGVLFQGHVNVGRIQVSVVVGLKFSASCWLEATFSYQRLPTTPCHMALVTTWQLTSSRPTGESSFCLLKFSKVIMERTFHQLCHII